MRLIPIIIIALLVSSCGNETNRTPENGDQKKNEVIVLGMIHGDHRKNNAYNVEVLRILIKKINPDLILVEIPPDRFPAAFKEFQEADTITEPRVVRFPEYVDVIFPLTKELDFTIIPTAGWTIEMSDARNKKLAEISKDSSRTDDWTEYTLAANRSDSMIKASGQAYDPYWINSEVYDSLVEIELTVYNRLFNDELGLGGWDNINMAHFANITRALDENKFSGKRILITYGAGHKGWFLRHLKKRDDIELLDLKEVVPQ